MTTKYVFQEWNPEGTRKLLLLHGFTGSEYSFERVVLHLSDQFHVVAPQLPGHGDQSADIKTYGMADQIQWLRQFIVETGFEKAAILGYSMGGRLAIGYALEYPVPLLILESASPGIEDSDERQARAEADAKLSLRIEEEGVPSFVAFWEQIPLFSTQKKMDEDTRRWVRDERLRHDAHELARSLRDFSTGNMPNYWNEIKNYENEVALLVGSLDHKFVSINERMATFFPHASLQVVEGYGHAIHVENPQMFATIVEELLLRRT